MANFKELFGDQYKPDMTLSEAEKLFEGKRLADLSSGEYVSKLKYDADTRLLSEYKNQLDGKQSEIDSAVKKAVEAAKAESKAEYEKQLETERTATKRKNAREKAYNGLTDEQRSIYDAFLKDDELKLSEDGEQFDNFEDLAKPIREKYKTLFPIDDGSHGRAGVKPGSGNSNPAEFDYSDYKHLR